MHVSANLTSDKLGLSHGDRWLECSFIRAATVPVGREVEMSRPHGARIGQEESFIAATIWTFVRLLHSVNGRSTADDVRRVV